MKIKNNNSENDKKFIIVKLNGAKPSIVNEPRKKGAINKTNNFLFKKFIKAKIHTLTN